MFMINTMKSEKPWHCYGSNLIGRNSMNFQISFNIYIYIVVIAKFAFLIVNMSLFIPAAVDQNLLPPPVSIDILTSNDPQDSQQCSTTCKIADMSFANVPFQ